MSLESFDNFLRSTWKLAILWWALAIFVASFIFDLALTPDTVANPNTQLPQASSEFLDTVITKGGHFVAFGILTFCLHQAVSATPTIKWSSWLLGALALSLAGVIGLVTEIGQDFVPGRTGNFWDFLIDFSGAIAGLVASIIATTVVKSLVKREVNDVGRSAGV